MRLIVLRNWLYMISHIMLSTPRGIVTLRKYVVRLPHHCMLSFYPTLA